ncbi:MULTISPECIES: acyltransferase family protein [Bacillaceae]|uniref:acyltransferase family protein n=1 Tax=Bacillaceae TaxID=186817 RepID=UPI00209E0369|nr:acyltransferase family protein [Bacillus infantis]MCP1160960.1 acyltransferase family protein [Bacillus infantis]MDW2876185.1 acyltransferase family protein [Bacillus infantis]
MVLPGQEKSRHYDLDWIKVLAMLVVFLYHCSMFFNSFEWHVKNDEINRTCIELFSLAVGNWIMPVFFAISGISTYHALKKRHSGAFLKERAARLGIPLLLGIFILSPPQVYIERLTGKQFEGSFFQFFPHYFDGLYLEIGGSGNFAFFGHHLWYLLMLLIFSALTLPFFLNERQRQHIQNGSFAISHYLFLPLPLTVAALWANDILNLASWGILFYLLLYAYGYYFFARESFRSFARNSGKLTGTISAVSLAAYILWVFMSGFPAYGTAAFYIFTVIRVLLVWNVLLFIFFLGDRHLNTSTPALSYASEAAMPFYILHQPVIIVSGFWIAHLDWSIPFKFVFLATAAFAVIMIFHHAAIRRYNGLRVVFGLRRQHKLAVPQETNVDRVV